jgi:long-subunit acyl-CoA synthetase (AMP-forming)
VTVVAARTLCESFAATVAAHAGEPALRTPEGEVAWTWEAYGRRVREAAAGLAGLGIRRGDAIACWLANRPEFHVADAAAMNLGAASVSVYSTFTVEQAEHIVADAGIRVLVTEPAFLDRAFAIRERGATALETVVLVEGSHACALRWDELLACAPEGFDFDRAAAAVEPGDLLTLIYTSGTTGPPKGVQLTHANVVAQVAALRERLPFPPVVRAISYLPMAHIAERLASHYAPMTLGWDVTTCADPRRVAALLPKVRPVLFFAPPRTWEKLRTAAAAAAGTTDATAVRTMLGLDEVRVAIVGAAPCPAEIVEFWQGLGVRLAELYGMSETTRVKELIINATGKNMSPANIEATVRAEGGLIGQVCCIGDGQPYNVALITLEPDIAAAFAARHAIADSSLAALATDKYATEIKELYR